MRLTLPQIKVSQSEAVVVTLPYGQTELCPVRALLGWLKAADINEGPVFRRTWLGRRPWDGEPDFPPRIGFEAISAMAIATIVKARASDAGFVGRDFGGHSLKGGALTTGMAQRGHPAPPQATWTS